MTSLLQNIARQFSSVQTPSWMGSRPKDVGICAMDVYFPSLYVDQNDLEVYDNVSQGKYTIGLGQSKMAVCQASEDINSACMTAVSNLMEKYNIPYSAIGRIEVGTESIVDKSKAVKTSLMDMFAEKGNTDIEGIDSKNACYGGTAAVLNSAAWIESSAWDGRYSIAIAGDIAVYEKGPARPTGGAGVVAMLIGPDAPLVLEPVRSTHMENVWDFYKPTMVSEYPRVDGHLSNECYLRSLDTCYLGYTKKWSQWKGQQWKLSDADYSIFHAPYNKLVQKSFGRLCYLDYRQNNTQEFAALSPYAEMELAATYNDREFQKLLSSVSKQTYLDMVKDSELITKECGNSYCGSLYAGLLSLITNKSDSLLGSRILMFSYGSGLAATLFSLKVNGDVGFIAEKSDVLNRLDSRVKVEPSVFEDMLDDREKNYTKVDYQLDNPSTGLFPGTFFLKEVDGLERRYYGRATTQQQRGMATVATEERSTPITLNKESSAIAFNQQVTMRRLQTTGMIARGLRRFLRR
eukprot:m.82580 g.82580  ORF g.82580 m.82580 type:complete len:519 (+) comp12091_c0_seq1:181-1737(+)